MTEYTHTNPQKKFYLLRVSVQHEQDPMLALWGPADQSH